MKIFLSILFLLFGTVQSYGQNITTIAGNGVMGYCCDNGPATNAQLNGPRDVEVDRYGNIYIADLDNSCIRKVDPLGIITTIAGIPGSSGFSGDNGMATDAKISEPFSIAIDKVGNLYIAARANQRIRKVAPSGVITTIAGTGAISYNGDNIQATTANLNFPAGVAVDKYGFVYICETYGYRVRKVDTSGVITTIAGGGVSAFSGDYSPATNASLVGPYKICADTSDNIYINDGSTRIRKIDINGIITTIAGNGVAGYFGDNGPATAAQMSFEGVRVDDNGYIYTAESSNARIRVVDPTGIIYTIAGDPAIGPLGDGGPATAASVYIPVGVAIDTTGNVFIAEAGHERIRKIYQHTDGVNSVSNLKSVTIFPNPSMGRFSVAFSSMQEWADIYVTDIMGREIKRISAVTTKQENVSIDASGGFYFVKITTPSGAYVQQLLLLDSL